METDRKIPPSFVQYAADILADTGSGLSGPDIVKVTAGYAVRFNVEIPHPTYPFVAPNKRTALFQNLMAFSAEQQFIVIRDLCDHHRLPSPPTEGLKRLKLLLATRYAELAPEGSIDQIDENLVAETRHWLSSHPQALSLYNDSLEKLRSGVLHRNLLDDLRLALEILLKTVFANEKSLENQIASIGSFIKSKGGSKELANMFSRLVDYFAHYQNSYVKHNDAVIVDEIEFVFEITSSFMKHLLKLHSRKTDK